MRQMGGCALAILFLAALTACGGKSGSKNDSPRGPGVPNPRADEKLGSWHYLASGTTANLNDVTTMYRSGIFAVGDGGTLLRSTDEGITWTRLDLGTDKDLHTIDWVNDTVFIGGDHVVYFSKDTGLTFAASAVDGVVRGMDYTSSGEGAAQFWVAGDDGFVAKAVIPDGEELDTFNVPALVWHSVQVADAPDLAGISLDFSEVLIAGKGGFVVNSTDLGDRFERITSVASNGDYLVVDGDFMAGDGFVSRREPMNGMPVGSYSWQLHGSSSLPRIEGLRCISICEVVGTTGGGSVILTLNDEFEVVETQAEHISAKLNAITGHDGDGRIAVGEGGTILMKPSKK